MANRAGPSRRRRWLVPAVMLGGGAAWVVYRRRFAGRPGSGVAGVAWLDRRSLARPVWGNELVESRLRTVLPERASVEPARRPGPSFPAEPARPTGPTPTSRSRRPADAQVEPTRPTDPPANAHESTRPSDPPAQGHESTRPSDPPAQAHETTGPFDSPATRIRAEAEPPVLAAGATEPAVATRDGVASSGSVVSHPRFGPGSALPLPDGAAPAPEYTIKGNAASMLFHPPASPYFRRTKAAVWFRSPDDARNAGFTEWRPKPRNRTSG